MCLGSMLCCATRHGTTEHSGNTSAAHTPLGRQSTYRQLTMNRDTGTDTTNKEAHWLSRSRACVQTRHPPNQGKSPYLPCERPQCIVDATHILLAANDMCSRYTFVVRREGKEGGSHTALAFRGRRMRSAALLTSHAHVKRAERTPHAGARAAAPLPEGRSDGDVAAVRRSRNTTQAAERPRRAGPTAMTAAGRLMAQRGHRVCTIHRAVGVVTTRGAHAAASMPALCLLLVGGRLRRVIVV